MKFLYPISLHRLSIAKEGSDHIYGSSSFIEFCIKYRKRNSQLLQLKLITMAEKEKFENAYMVKTSLTALGEKYLDILSRGYVIEIEKECINYDETFNYYSDILDQKAISKVGIERIMQLEEPMFKPLHAKATMRVLQMRLADRDIYVDDAR